MQRSSLPLGLERNRLGDDVIKASECLKAWFDDSSVKGKGIYMLHSRYRVYFCSISVSGTPAGTFFTHILLSANHVMDLAR